MSSVPSITSARPSRALDRRTRERRYVLTMSVRVVCFVLALVVGGWVRWVFVAGAVVLPYVAVVLANVASSRLGRGVDESIEPLQLASAADDGAARDPWPPAPSRGASQSAAPAPTPPATPGSPS